MRLEHITMPLVPRCVVNFGHDILQFRAVGFETIKKRNRIHHVTKVPQMRQQANGTCGPNARSLLHERPDGFVKRLGRIAEMIRSSKPRNCRSPG